MPVPLIVLAVGVAAGAMVSASMQPGAAQTDYSTSINTSGVNAEKPVTYGQAKAGAHKVFSEVVRSDSGDNDLLTVIYSLGEGPVHAINQLYIDDLPLFSNERDYTSGTIGQTDIHANFKSHVQVQISNGAPEGYRFTMAEQNSDGRWAASSTGNNVVSVCLKIKLDGYKGKIKSDNFNLTAKLKGVPVVDITKVDEPFVYQYDGALQPGRNPALCLYDYLSNIAYGCAIEPEFLDKQSFIQAANWCDVNDLKIDGVVNQGQSYEENIKNLLTAFGGMIVDYNGDLYCVVDKPSVTVMDFDLSNTIGSIEIDYYPSENYFNQLETTWKDPSQNFKDDVVVYPPSIDDPTIQSDGFVKTNRLELPFTKNKANVDFLSSKFVKHAKSKTTISFTADVDGYLVQVSDVISMSNDNRGWDKRLFRITEIERETFGDKVGQVKITATEYNEDVYVDSWVGDSTPVLTQPKSVPAVTNLSFTFKESRYGITGELTWNSTAYQIQETLVMYKLSAEPDTSFELYTKVEGSSCMFTSLKNNFYDFQVVNRDIFGSTSEAVYLRNVDLVDDTIFPSVTGLTTLPLNTPDFVFNWDDMMDVDVSVVDGMNPSVIGQGKVKDYFLAYELTMKVNGNVVSTHNVTSNTFTYTYDLNVKDGLSRDVTAEVRIVGVAGAKSPVASFRAINLQQQVPNGITVQGGQANLFIAFDASTEADHKGTEIHVSTTRDFTPSPLTLLSDLSSNTFTFTTMNPNTYFVRLGAYDVFDRNNIVYSNQYETSIVSVESQLEAISKDQLNVDLFNEISNKSNQSDIDTAIAAIPVVDTTALEAATALVARNLVDAEAKTTADLLAAKNKATADLASAKAELQQAIDDKTVDLSPINTRIAQVEKQSKDADKAYAARMSSVETKANSQQASIDSIERSVSTNTSSLATKITSVEAKTIADSSAKTTGDAALQEAKQNTAASITTEKNARTAADSALSTRINTVTAAANKNKADITTVEQSVVDTEQALATKINTVKAEASTDAANKANAAKASAITTAAATAQAKATKALNDAKADTTGKVSATQIEAARDAKAKADAALVAAKAEAKKLTDAAIATSNSHSDAVITNERTARTTADSALSTRIDTNKAKTDKAAADIIVTNKAIVGNEAAMASKVTAMESSVKTDSTNKANQALADANSYTDDKAYQERLHTMSRYNEVIDIIGSTDAAQATKISTLQSSMTNIKQTGMPYTKSFYVEGDHDKYYPVYFKGGNQNIARTLRISRAYHEIAPTEWNNSTHKGGLLLDITANFGGWGGQHYDWKINAIEQSYTHMFAGAHNAAYNMYFCVYLRGGHALYHVASELSISTIIGYSTADIVYPNSNPSYQKNADAPRTSAWSRAEINAKLKGTKEYAGLSNVDNLSAEDIRAPVRTELNAAITTVEQTATTDRNASASRMTTIESSVTTTANNAATDATNKANNALTSAKQNTTTKFNEAVNTASTALAAEASKVSTLEAKMNYVSDAAEQAENGDMLLNGRFTKKDKDGRPLGWYAAYSNSTPSTIGYDSTGAYLTSNSDTSIGMSSNAFRVEKNTTYKIKIRVKAEQTTTAGFYCWGYEYDAELPKGKFAISNSSGEAAVQEDTRIKQFWTNQSVSTEWTTYEFIYTPNSSAVFTSIGFLNWSAMGANNKLYIDYCVVTQDHTVYVDSKYTDVVNLFNTKDASQTSKITSLTSTVNNNTSSITSTSSTLATLDGKVNSTYALRVDANGKIAGFGLSNNGTSSTFAINADDFLIYDGTSDNAVFSVTDGKLLVNNAMIGELDASNIAVGSINSEHLTVDLIDASHISVGAMDAVNANIKDGAITNAMITNVIQSSNYVDGADGWKLDKGGFLEANNAKFRGTIESSFIKGAFIEGGIVMGGTDFVTVTEADNGSLPRKACYAGATSSAAVSSGRGWSSYGKLAVCSADYTGDGNITYKLFGSNQTVAKNFNRSRTIIPTVTGSVSCSDSSNTWNDRYGQTFRVRFIVEVYGVNKAGAQTKLGGWTVFDSNKALGSWGTHSLTGGASGTVVVSKATGKYWYGDSDNGYYRHWTYITGVRLNLTGLPNFNYRGNYEKLAVRVHSLAYGNRARQSACPNSGSFTIK